MMEPFTCAIVRERLVTATGHETITLNGVPITLDDWIDDPVYSTVTVGATAAADARRPLPAFGEFPGERGQDRVRWPDVLHWYVNQPNDPTQRHHVLHELRDGGRHMTRMLAKTIVMGLNVRECDKIALVDMVMSTHFGDSESEWALANLIDAAVELAADEHERLAQVWADAARARVFTVHGGSSL